MSSRSASFGIVALLGLAGCALEPVHLDRGWTALDTDASAEVYATTERVAVAMLDEMERATGRVEAILLSGHLDSEIDRLNREAGRAPYAVQERDLYRCISLGLQYAKASDGTYDPTIGPLTDLYAGSASPDARAIERAREPVGWEKVVLFREALAVRFPDERMKLELGDMAPGYALDVAARVFSRIGSLAGLLRLGPAVYAWGLPPGEEAWTVELDDPRRPGGELATVRIGTRAIVVAAGVDPWGRPRIDPRSGRPAAGDVLVAVAIADSAGDAGAIAAALRVGGSLRAGALLSKTHRVEGVLVVAGEEGTYVLASASLAGRLELSEAVANEAGGVPRFLLPPVSY